MAVDGYQQQVRADDRQLENRKRLYTLFKNTPIPVDQLLVNLPLYMRSSVVAKMLYFDELYRMILKIPGHILEFGVWWGQNLVLLENLRAVHEPYNHSRRIVGFDTFTGYPSPGDQDKGTYALEAGGYTVSEGYVQYLREILAYHEQENVMGHIKKTNIVVGDVRDTLGAFLAERPEFTIALAEFDLALYEPTKVALEAIKPRLLPGSVIALDEFNSGEMPGETQAFREVFGSRGYLVRRSAFLPDRTYVILQ